MHFEVSFHQKQEPFLHRVPTDLHKRDRPHGCLLVVANVFLRRNLPKRESNGNEARFNCQAALQQLWPPCLMAVGWSYHAWLQGRNGLPEATTDVNNDRAAQLRAAACARLLLLPLLLPTLALRCFTADSLATYAWLPAASLLTRNRFTRDRMRTHCGRAAGSRLTHD